MPFTQPERPSADSFDGFFRVEYPVLVALGVALTGDRELARDVAQEALLRAFRRWDQVARMDRPGAWCRQVALNLIRDRWRRRRSEQVALGRVQRDLRVVPPPPTPADEFWRAVRELPERQREAIALYYVADRSVAEVAATMATAEGTVKGTLHDARRALAARLGTRAAWEDQ